MTWNGVMALILRYFTEIGSFRGALRKGGWRSSWNNFAFVISSPDEFLGLTSVTQAITKTWVHLCQKIQSPPIKQRRRCSCAADGQPKRQGARKTQHRKNGPHIICTVYIVCYQLWWNKDFHINFSTLSCVTGVAHPFIMEIGIKALYRVSCAV